MAFQIRGIEELSASEKEDIQLILSNFELKLKNFLLEDYALKLDIKIHSRAMENVLKSKNYELNLSVISSRGRFESSCADWDLKKVVHIVCEKIIQEVRHSFRK
jgi:hypothetical protein